MRLLKRLTVKCKIVFLNVFTIMVNIFVRRDAEIWIFGSWMGDKFADNSRFLFQYLAEHKNEYGIKSVVWITRSKAVYLLMKSMGYQVYMAHSFQSYYYHFKAGVHVVCNMYSSDGGYLGDIMGNLSWGAKKIQLWHGVGIKACGGLTNAAQINASGNRLHKFLSKPIFQPGRWKAQGYFLATSLENERVAVLDHGYQKNRLIEGIYPRLCPCVRLLNNEKAVIEQLVEIRNGGNKVILYLPTFRKNNSFIEPRQIDGFEGFLKKNGFIWIEKKHSADTRNEFQSNGENIVCLESNFDINVIYEYIDLVISDYSSAVSDAAYHGVLTLDYCPDYDKYRDTDRGFVAPYGDYHICDQPIMNANELEAAIVERFDNAENYKRKTKQLSTYLYAEHKPDYDILVKNIINKIQYVSY